MKIEGKIRKALGYKIGSVLLYHMFGAQKFRGKWQPYYTPYIDRFLTGMSVKERKQARWKLEQKGYMKVRQAKRNEGRVDYECRIDRECLRNISRDFGEELFGVKPEPKQDCRHSSSAAWGWTIATTSPGITRRSPTGIQSGTRRRRPRIGGGRCGRSDEMG
jgi:hypothetical protein